MKAKPYLYLRFHISSDPISAKNYFASSERFLTQSSLQAATTKYPSGIIYSVL